MGKIWPLSSSHHLPFFPKTPNEMDKGFSYDIFQVQGTSFPKKKTMTDELINFGQCPFLFLILVS